MPSSPPAKSPLKTFAMLRNGIRAKEIFVVLLRNGFNEIIDKIYSPKSFFRHVIPKPDKSVTLWRRIRITCEELGPTFVKFGQILCTREDILPLPLIEELKLLRDNVTPVPWEQIEPVFDAELENGIAAHFSEFDKTPAASGSVGQVYRARLKSGEEVAVKIRRPGAARELTRDFEILAWLVARAAEKIPELASYDLAGILDEIRDGVLRETDFSIEARNAEYFNASNPFPEVFAPKIYAQLSTKRVLVSEWIRGTAPGKSAAPAPEAARSGARSLFHQIFTAGFFHADPHSGNVLLTEDGRVCFIDWGVAGTLSRRMRYFLADIFAAAGDGNAERTLQTVLRTYPPENRANKAKAESEIALVLRRHQDFAQRGGSLGRMIFDMLRALSSCGMPLPRDYALLAKSVVVMEETGRAADPNFSIRPFAQEALSRLYAERHNPKTLAGDVFRGAERSFAYVREMPESVQRILWKIEKGEAKINIDHEGLNSTRITLDRATNRLSLAIIIAALLVASALLVCSAALGGNERGFAHHLGVAGFIVAAVWTAWLTWIILRRKT